MNMKLFKRRVRGVTLVELMITLFILGLTAVAAVQVMRDSADDQVAQEAADNIKTIGQGVFAYIPLNAETLKLQPFTDVTVDQLKTANVLPPTYSAGAGANWSGGYNIRIKRLGAASPFMYEALVMTKNPYKVNSALRIDVIGNAVKKLGAAGGMTYENFAAPASAASGSGGIRGRSNDWYLDSADYPFATSAGHLAYFVSSASINDAVYLRRDGGNNMLGQLDMNGNPIKEATTISAQGNINTAGGNITADKGNLVAEGGGIVTGAMYVSNKTFAVNTPCPQESAISKSPAGFLLVCSNGVWNILYSQSLSGAACSPNGSTAYTPAGGLLICLSGEYRDVTTLLFSGNVGQACSPDGVVGSTKTGIALYCQSGVWAFLADRFGRFATTDTTLVKNGTVFPIPNCQAGGQPKVYFNPQGVDSRLYSDTAAATNFRADTTSNPGQYTAIVDDTRNPSDPKGTATDGYGLALTGCFYD